MIAHKSIRIILPPLIIGLILYFYIMILGILILSFALYLIWFFRDPAREVIIDNKSIYAAADGKIIFVEETVNAVKIGIRMSPFDVHLNRSPVKGRVSSIEHTPGSHSNVYFGNIENKNERNLIKINSEEVNCEILQITGSFARRIECWVEENDLLQQGQKIGIIRFGSQTNMYIETIPTDKSIKAAVKQGDKVKAGLTAVAKIEEKFGHE